MIPEWGMQALYFAYLGLIAYMARNFFADLHTMATSLKKIAEAPITTNLVLNNNGPDLNMTKKETVQ